MRATYRVLAFLVAIEVMIQAAAIVYAVAGLGKWIEDGNTLDKAAMESDDTSFDGIVGFMVHGMNGMMIIPLIALALLIVSFFAKVEKGVMWAGIVLGLVVLQVALGLYGHEVPAIGGLHGLNALVLFGTAVTAGMRAKAPTVESSATGYAGERTPV